MAGRIAALIISLTLCACARQDAPSDAAHEPPPAEAAFVLPAPAVEMEADPAPPFTYWAPQGASIRNHPTNPGIWLAYKDGRNVATYFGDDCHASDYQRFVGQPMSALPPESARWRSACDTCAVHSDLRPDRVNVVFDDATRIVERIACY